MGPVLAYFITFSTYGARLSGDERGYVDRRENLYGFPLPLPNRARSITANQNMVGTAQVLSDSQRAVVLGALMEVCGYRSWELLAAHVRSNHVHVVVSASASVASMLRDFKAYASRRLNERDSVTKKRWAEHASTRYLWNEKSIWLAVQYVVEEQGEPMAVYVCPTYLAAHSEPGA
jgi:REP element-mobilizing transposase RayT